VKAYEFIFSNRLSYRLSRHVIFWIVFLIYFYSISFLPTKPADIHTVKTYVDGFRLMIFIPISVISVYISIYFLLPRYILTEKYFSLALVSIALTACYLLLAWMLTLLLAYLTTSYPLDNLPVSIKWFEPIRYGIGLPLTSAVFVIIIKLLKHWHIEQKENELLQRRKIYTELQLLKTQFQPNFLYDALQHLFYLIYKHSPESPETVLKLSDLLSYILHDVEKETVPLDKEIRIVRTYLGLKKVFYPDRLWIQFKEEGPTKDICVSPLLLVSIVENCLGNFLKETTHQLNIVVDIKTENKDLYFLLEYTTDADGENPGVAGQDWIKSRKTVELMYPGRHSFDVYAENGTTSLLLVLEGGEIVPSINKEEFVLT
jgi:sensor histidine kinase YesM